MMSGNQKGFSTVVFVFATLLSCCFSPVSSFLVLPRITRTSDAVIIDYEAVGSFSVGRASGVQHVDPGYIPLPTFHPYGMFYNGWSHFVRQGAAPAVATTCGKGPAAITSTKTMWPFLVTLRNSSDVANAFYCAGTLISDSKVLLAAQCLEKMSLFEISKVTVVIGLAPVTPLTAQMTRRISRIVIHSGYNAATYANDIAIITLDMPVVISRNVGPACVAPASTDPDQYIDKEAGIMGWGKATVTSTLAASELTDFKQGKVTIGSVADCKSEPYGKYVTDNNICIVAGVPFTCLGDIGGPVVINTAATTAGTPAVWTVVGINSYTKDCQTTGLKTRVSAFSAWIATYMV